MTNLPTGFGDLREESFPCEEIVCFVKYGQFSAEKSRTYGIFFFYGKK